MNKVLGGNQTLPLNGGRWCMAQRLLSKSPAMNNLKIGPENAVPPLQPPVRQPARWWPARAAGRGPSGSPWAPPQMERHRGRCGRRHRWPGTGLAEMQATTSLQGSPVAGSGGQPSERRCGAVVQRLNQSIWACRRWIHMRRWTAIKLATAMQSPDLASTHKQLDQFEDAIGHVPANGCWQKEWHRFRDGRLVGPLLIHGAGALVAAVKSQSATCRSTSQFGRAAMWRTCCGR